MLHAAALSSLSAPRITILSASSGNGLCNAFASSHGARIQTSRSSSVVKITGIAYGMDRLNDGVRGCRQKPVNEVRAWDRLRLCASVTLEFGPDASEGE